MLLLMMIGPHRTCLTEDIGYLLLLAFYLCDISHAWVDINSWMQIMLIMLRVGNPGCMDVMWWPTRCLCLDMIMLYLISQNVWHTSIVMLGKQTMWISMLLMHWFAWFWYLKHDEVEYVDPGFGHILMILLWLLILWITHCLDWC